MTTALFITHPMQQPSHENRIRLREAGCAVVVCDNLPVTQAVMVDLINLSTRTFTRRDIDNTRPSLN